MNEEQGIPAEHGELIRRVSADVVQQVGMIRMKLGDRIAPILSTNFVTNVCTSALALSLELMIEEMKGEIDLDPNIDEHLVEMKKKLGVTIRDIISERAGPGWITVQKHTEVDDPPAAAAPGAASGPKPGPTPSQKAQSIASAILDAIFSDPEWEKIMSLIVGNLGGHVYAMIRRHRGQQEADRWLEATERVRLEHIKNVPPEKPGEKEGA